MSFFIGLLGNWIAGELVGLAYALLDRWLVSIARKVTGELSERLLEEWRSDLSTNPSVIFRFSYVFDLAWQHSRLIAAAKDWHAAPPMTALSIRPRASVDLPETRRALAQATLVLGELTAKIEGAVALRGRGAVVDHGELARAGVQVTQAFLAAQEDLISAHGSGLVTGEETAMALVTCRKAGETAHWMAETLRRLQS